MVTYNYGFWGNSVFQHSWGSFYNPSSLFILIQSKLKERPNVQIFTTNFVDCSRVLRFPLWRYDFQFAHSSLWFYLAFVFESFAESLLAQWLVESFKSLDHRHWKTVTQQIQWEVPVILKGKGRYTIAMHQDFTRLRNKTRPNNSPSWPSFVFSSNFSFISPNVFFPIWGEILVIAQTLSWLAKKRKLKLFCSTTCRAHSMIRNTFSVTIWSCACG